VVASISPSSSDLRRKREPFGLLPLGDEDFQDLHPAADQFGQLLVLLGAGRGGFGLQSLAIGRQDSRVYMIGLGALAGGTGKVPDPGRVQDTDRNVGLMQCGDDLAFVAAGGFTDDLNGGVMGEELQEPAVAGRSVGQVVDPTAQMELQVLLGNIQARINSGHGVLAHSCKYELALVGRSVNGSSLGHRSERFWLPTRLDKNLRQRITNSSAPLPSRLQAGRHLHLPIQLNPDKDR